MPARVLPARPDLDQLKHQAKDLLRAFRDGEPPALADFKEFHPDPVDRTGVQLAAAQLVLARSYQASSWPQLVAACEALSATSRDDFDALGQIVAAHPELVRERGNGRATGWRQTIAEAADLGLRRIITTLQGLGMRSIDAAGARPDMRPWIDRLRLLGRIGARPPADALGGAVEILRGADFALMAEVGAEIRDHKGLTALALETYARNPEGKHRILEVMAEQGVPLPDTPPMAVHRGRLDLLEAHLRREPAMLTRTFTHQEIYPPALECHADEWLALTGVRLKGATLLHMATDYEEEDVARWLLDHGMDVNARASIDADGIGGHIALFNCVLTYNAGRKDEPLARLLLERGADPNARASIRHKLPFAKDTSLHEYHDVSPVGLGKRFHDQSYVSGAALRLIEANGGRE